MATAVGFDTDCLIRIRRARRLALIFVVGYLPLGFALFFLDAPQSAGTFALATWLIIALGSLWNLRAQLCPQCGLMFYADSKWGQTNLHIPFARNCMHCGFALTPGAENSL